MQGKGEDARTPRAGKEGEGAPANAGTGARFARQGDGTIGANGGEQGRESMNWDYGSARSKQREGNEPATAVAARLGKAIRDRDRQSREERGGFGLYLNENIGQSRDKACRSRKDKAGKQREARETRSDWRIGARAGSRNRKGRGQQHEDRPTSSM